MRKTTRAQLWPLAAGLCAGLVVATGVDLAAVVPGQRPGQEAAATGGDAPLRARVVQPPDGRDLAAGPRTVAPVPTAACGPRTPAGALCDHGSEPPPPGVDVRALPSIADLRARRHGPPAARGGAEGPLRRGSSDPRPSPAPDVVDVDPDGLVTPELVAATGAVTCVTDGVTGPRVQAVYAHASDVRNRYTDALPLITAYAGDVATRINAAAGRSGQGRLVRYVTSGSPCALKVANVTLSPTGDDTFANTIAELRSKGFDRADRKYLVWVDAAVGICGIANLYQDDKPTLDNLNTRGNMFARVDAPCWGYAELHELLHVLGAVQDAAPNSTGAGHCVDEQDAMCYPDTSAAPMRQVCPDAPAWGVDCRLDDYFNAAPPPDSYLARNWNTARNPYLNLAPPPPAPVRLTLASADTAFAGNAWTVRADITLPPGRRLADFTWTSSRSDCRFADPTAPTTVFHCPVTAADRGQVTARAVDDARTEAVGTRTFTLVVPSAPRRTSAALTGSATSVRRGTALTLRTRLRDPETGRGVIGMPVALYRRLGGTVAWEKVATRPTAPDGTATFRVAPLRTTDYRTVSGSSRTWASARSVVRRVRVTAP